MHEQEAGKQKKSISFVSKLDRSKLELIIGIILIAAMVLLYISTFAPKTTSVEETPVASTYNYLGEEQRLTAVLSRIEGAGEVQVMITYSGGNELVPAYNSDSSIQSTDETNQSSGIIRSTRNESESRQPVTWQDGTVLISEKRPDVIGVIIVAQGAENVVVRMALQRAAQTALNVPLNKVEVFEMSK